MPTIYSSKAISDFLKNIGYQAVWINAPWITLRNSEGTELRFLDNKREKIIVLFCDGSIKEIDMTGYLCYRLREIVVFWRFENAFFPGENDNHKLTVCGTSDPIFTLKNKENTDKE